MDDRDNLLVAETNLSQIERLARDTKALLPDANGEAKERLIRIQRDARALRLAVPTTLAALATA